MAHNEQLISSQEIEALKRDFLKALFSPPDRNSPFGSAPEDLPLEPSSIVIREEERFKKLAGEMFGFMGRVISPNSEVVTPKIYRDVDEEEGTTFCRAVLGLNKEWRLRLPERFQLWVTEKALIETEDPVRKAERIDGWIRGEMERLFSEFIRTSETNVPKAAEIKKITLEKIIGLAVRPIEVTSITFQSLRMEDGRPTYTSLLGLRLIHCVAGSQAYPVIFKGRGDIVCYQMPLLGQTTTFDLDSRLGQGAIFGLVDEGNFKSSILKAVIDPICNRAFRSTLCARK